VDLNATDQLLIIHSAFFKYLRKKGEYIEVVRSASAVNILQESL
jgi:hypothetical protein